MPDLRDFKGGEQIARRLLAMTDKLRTRYMRRGLGMGAALIQAEAIQQAPIYHGDPRKGHPPPGTLRRAIVSKFIPERSSTVQAVYYVTVRHGRNRRHVRQTIFHVGLGQSLTYDTNLDAYYWRFTEFGTAKMSAANGGNGFMRPAFRAKRDAALDVIKAQWWAGVIEGTKAT